MADPQTMIGPKSIEELYKQLNQIQSDLNKTDAEGLEKISKLSMDYIKLAKQVNNIPALSNVTTIITNKKIELSGKLSGLSKLEKITDGKKLEILINGLDNLHKSVEEIHMKNDPVYAEAVAKSRTHTQEEHPVKTEGLQLQRRENEPVGRPPAEAAVQNISVGALRISAIQTALQTSELDPSNIEQNQREEAIRAIQGQIGTANAEEIIRRIRNAQAGNIRLVP